MYKKDINFNEDQFIDFLQNDNSNLLSVATGSKYGFVQELNLSKVKVNSEYSIILNMKYFKFDSLEKLYFSNHGLSDIQGIGVYFHKINTVVFEESYTTGDIQERCKELKVYYKEDLYKEIREKANKIFDNSFNYLIQIYKNDDEMIHNKREQMKDRIYRIAVLEEEDHRELMNERHFRDYESYQMLYDYLNNGDEFVQSFVNNYTVKKEDHIRNIVCYEIAKEKLLEELKEDQLIRKARKIRTILNNELKHSKKVWVIDTDDTKNQVENQLHINSYQMEIGSFPTKVPIENVTTITYGKKEYSLI